MMIATNMIWVALIVLIALAVGAIVLQIFLSRQESRWPGLVLPILSFVNSLLPVLGMVGFGGVSVNAARIWSSAGAVFLLMNLPTAVLLAIYVACQKGRARKNELERMRAKDLE